LCNERKTTPNAVCLAIGKTSATATKWKNGAVPRDTTLHLIADYFGITVEDLLRDPNEQPTEPAVPAELAQTSPLSTKFNDLLGQMTLQDLIELQQIMEEKIKNRK
jgi:hypothetical protein